MQDIRRSLMIFHLKDGYSKEELQKAYKKLVKKYHPDFNQENQDWSHKKMIEINLAYDQCKDHLLIRTQEPIPAPSDNIHKKSEGGYQDVFHTVRPGRHHNHEKVAPSQEQSRSSELLDGMTGTTARFNRITGRYYEYGLDNRYLRYEGNRRFRYRQCHKEFQEILQNLERLHQFCQSNYDIHIQTIYKNFITNYYKYIILDEVEIPRHPSINSHWNKMEEYMNACLKDYLAPFLTDHFGKISWKVYFTQSVNHIHYLQSRFPRLNKDKSFKIIVDLAESYSEIREEEEKNKIRFFQP